MMEKNNKQKTKKISTRKINLNFFNQEVKQVNRLVLLLLILG